MDTEKIKKIIQESNITRSEIEEKPIIAIYLFGSYAKGKEKAKSDIDLAFIFDERFYKEDPFGALQEAELLSAQIGKTMHKAVDVVILNGSSLGFAYHAIRNGICLYESSTVDRILYEVALDNKYQDFMPFIKELREAKRRSLIGRD